MPHTPVDGPVDARGLDGSVAVANAAQAELRLVTGTPAGPGWVRCADLLADPERWLVDWADATAGWLRAEHGDAPDRTIAGHLLGWYLSVPARAAALLFRTTRRVPDIDPGALAFGLAADAPRPDRVALLRPEFAGLPGDPAAGRRSVLVAADAAALAGLFRDRYTTHADEFLEAFGAVFGSRVRLGRHALWAAATDALDGAIWRTGQHCGDEAGGVADAALVLPAAVPPLTSASTLRPSGPAEARIPGEAWTRRRQTCCFHYVLRNGSGPCATCPRLCHPGLSAG